MSIRQPNETMTEFKYGLDGDTLIPIVGKGSGTKGSDKDRGMPPVVQKRWFDIRHIPAGQLYLFEGHAVFSGNKTTITAATAGETAAITGEPISIH